jgi:hypothetical protein
MFWDTVHLSHVNLNPIHPYEERVETEVGCLAANFDARASRSAGSAFGPGGNGTGITDIETRPISPWTSSRTPLPAPQPVPRPPPGLRANADPFAFRPARQLNRQIGVRTRHRIRIAAVRRWILEALGRAK